MDVVSEMPRPVAVGFLTRVSEENSGLQTRMELDCRFTDEGLTDWLGSRTADTVSFEDLRYLVHYGTGTGGGLRNVSDGPAYEVRDRRSKRGLF